MKLSRISCLLLLCSVAAFCQADSELFDKAPPPIDEALRVRVKQFYEAEMAGKFKEAYAMVADDSQDAFLEASKQKYQSCETIKIHYADNFTTATVVEGCKGYWTFEGHSTLASFPITTTWKVADGQWFWYYVKPKFVPSPFSPTGFIAVPQGKDPSSVSVLPTDVNTEAKNILALVSVDKEVVHLRTDQDSEDVIHVRNKMPGSIQLHLDKLDVPGLRITLGKTQLNANEETTVAFNFRLEAPEIACVDCAKKLTGTPTVQLYVSPTGQRFVLKVVLEHQHPVEQTPNK
ncbi:MAG TPA: hypothetical protein VMU80_23695 [Bryobacteraceae bacterium]|nr:hypothetical protein [Bryobacteraceae bacterium]HUO32240.1 hypothetical protein [Bryobacteraceae bacterium]